MLKALELIGFKSFADKTQFEFDRGITAIVGPNGGGKSNVVDAIKWVLGEQSAKSLRGREMADVIFNGSGTRQSMGMAEVTLVFDNQARLFPLESEEVAISRRVYRSGEGEYLINRQLVRLRDIRDLFMGTGAATEAYSIIEQGKVDVLLQASTKERRFIFEEAAGISRFKAKKSEALRKLEHADQNLLRIDDVLEEVQRQLRSVRQQSSRARRYREYADQLRRLRVGLALVDFRSFEEELVRFQQEAEHLQGEEHRLASQLESGEAESDALDAAIAGSEEKRRHSDAQLAENQRRIDASQSLIEHQSQRQRDWQSGLSRYHEQRAELSQSIERLHRRSQEIAEQLDQFAQACRAHEAEVHIREAELESITEHLQRQQQLLEQHRTALMDFMRQSAELSNQRAGYEAQRQSLLQSRERIGQRLEYLTQHSRELEGDRERFQQDRDQTLSVLEGLRQQLQQLTQRRQELVAQRDQALSRLHQLRERRTAAAERARLLEDLQRRQEGLDQGVKHALAQRQRPQPGVWAQLQGLVADLVEVDVEHARLIELALGPRSATLVFHSGHFSAEDILYQVSRELKGRVGVIVLESDEPAPTGHTDAQPTSDGISPLVAVGAVRADTLVRTREGMEPLVPQLLGRTWIVPDLSTALGLHRQAHAPCRFVTQGGEVVEADGTVELGPFLSAAAGLISRKSELRALEQRLVELDESISGADAGLTRAHSQLAECEHSQQQVLQRVERQAEDMARQDARLQHSEQELAELNRDREIAVAELGAIENEIEQTTRVFEQSLQQLEHIQGEVTAQNRAIAQAEEELAQVQHRRQEVEQRVTAAKLEWTKSHERLQALQQQAQQLDREREHTEQSLADLRREIMECRQRMAQSQREILQAESALAALVLEKEELGRKSHALAAERDEQRARRHQLTAKLAQLRQQIHELQRQTHQQQLRIGDLAHRRQTLVERIREDYELDLAELAGRATDGRATTQELEASDQTGPTQVPSSELQEASRTDENEISGDGPRESASEYDLPADQSRSDVEAEIEQLRRKLHALGPVNLDSLRELEELETRSGVLGHQRGDLLRAKEHQEEIIRKISAESRRLFAETLETVRGHFQELFRKLFGGGRADIILEDEEDILESGIEIIARPPGKEPRNLSQLSGGEKTLTAVALLLGIFRSRPSPFCVLDEVDAALDEGNIDRFIAVLREFLSWTQFILITHSKRTITCAGVLYGITMQESGVSKRVAVRLEDLSGDGQIEIRTDSAHTQEGPSTARSDKARSSEQAA